MAQVRFVLISGAEIDGFIQGNPGYVATQVSEAMTGTRPLIIYGLPRVEENTINVLNPAATAAVRIMEEEPIAVR